MKELLIIFAIRVLEGIGLGIGVLIALIAYDVVEKR